MLYWLDVSAREMMLFAAVGFLISGIDDLFVDLLWLGRSLWRRLVIFQKYSPATINSLAPPAHPGKIAILIGAWAESPVIGAMLRAALARIEHDDYRIYVGTYANDAATVRVVAEVAREDPRIRLVAGQVIGPTTKGECLNRVWAALVDDERNENIRYKAVVLHDAEDVLHSAELALFDRMIERFDLVQLPVLPLRNEASRWVAGHYCDEFAEAHHRQLVVREAIGAGIPLAGVGCAISRAAMERMAEIGKGRPFDEASLTEDYEIGLRLADLGHGAAFVTVPLTAGANPIAIRAHFPDTITTAVRQKTRWMIGIALAGWDRLGWRGGWAEWWMRLRDRRALLAALVLGVAYLALALYGLSTIGHFIALSDALPLSSGLSTLLWINAALLVWRAMMRFHSVRHFYGWREGCVAVLRIVPANIIAMMAARRALFQYWRLLKGDNVRWDKTTHVFPETLPIE